MKSARYRWHRRMIVAELIGIEPFTKTVKFGAGVEGDEARVTYITHLCPRTPTDCFSMAI
jgi:hypothetical protein